MLKRAACSRYSAATTPGLSRAPISVLALRLLGTCVDGRGSTSPLGGCPTTRSNVARLVFRLARARSSAATAPARRACACATSVRVTSPTANRSCVAFRSRVRTVTLFSRSVRIAWSRTTSM